jgi:hypothetical protein
MKFLNVFYAVIALSVFTITSSNAFASNSNTIDKARGSRRNVSRPPRVNRAPRCNRASGQRCNSRSTTSPRSRDHRTTKPPRSRDHRTTKPPRSRDHRTTTPPRSRDHRTTKPPRSRDHRTTRPPRRSPDRYDRQYPRRRYSRHHHVPHRSHRAHNRRYNNPRSYHYTIPYRYIYSNRWIRFSVTWNNGYYWNDYPYYVYNGYRHRYSNYDICNYELVNSLTNEVVRSYPSMTCNYGYDLCSSLRDDLNYDYGSYRFFCSERYSRDYDYNY